MKGSSETTREAFCFDLYKKNKPQQIPLSQIRNSFLEWFVGFSEGDATFSAWFVKGRKRAAFVIDQKDRTILYHIRKELGFGKITLLTRGYWRYSVYDNEHLIKLYCLFAGNLVLNKRNLVFEKWATYLKFPKDFSISKEYLQHIQKNNYSGVKAINCNNAWLSGFWDADGGFSAYANYATRLPNIILRAYLTQNGEIEALREIAIVIDKINGKEKYIGTLTNNTSLKKYNRLEFASNHCLVTLLSYFQKYKLVGCSKYIIFRRWERLYGIREEIRKGEIEMSEKSLKKLTRLIESTKKNKMMI